MGQRGDERARSERLAAGEPAAKRTAATVARRTRRTHRARRARRRRRHGARASRRGARHADRVAVRRHRCAARRRRARESRRAAISAASGRFRPSTRVLDAAGALLRRRAERLATARPMRALYTFLWHLALPFLPLRLWWRGRREPGYREHIGERFGRYDDDRSRTTRRRSSGCTRSRSAKRAPPFRSSTGCTAPIPTRRCSITHMTATGRAAGQAHCSAIVPSRRGCRTTCRSRSAASSRTGARGRAHHGDRAVAESRSRSRAIDRRAGLPGQRADVEAVRVRLCARLPSLTRPMLASLAGVAAQSEADAARLSALGAPAPLVTGNLKFDIDIADTALALGREFRAALRRDASRSGSPPRRAKARRR